MNSSEEALWAQIDAGEVLFEGEVLKRSEILGRWNERHVRIVRTAAEPVLCLYWACRADARDKAPRGILDASSALLANDPQLLQVEIRHVRDMLRDADCFGTRKDIAVVLRVVTMDTFEALCGALGGAVAFESVYAVSSAISYERERPAGFGGEGQDSNSSQPRSLESMYELLGELGKGAFSTVYRARPRRGGGPEVAIKVVMLDKLAPRERKTQMRYLNSEVAVMRKLRERMRDNQHVVHLLESMAETRPRSRMSMVLQLCNGGELFDRIVQRNSFSEKDAKHVVRCLAATLRDMHAAGVVHRDLKPENLIYDSPEDDAVIKITDFGLALDADHAENDVYRSHVVGTVGYFAPEVLSLRYSPACDVWSLGVITYILLCGYPPFAGRTRMEVQKEIRMGRYQFHMPEWENISLMAQDLISKMLEFRPRRRIRPEQILEHSWMTVDQSSDAEPLPLKKHKQFNHRRKLKAAAYAVIWGARLSNQRKTKLNSLASKLKPEGLGPQDLHTIKEAFDRHSTESSDGSPASKCLATLDQLRGLLSELGFEQVPLERLFEVLDEDRNGLIDQRELLAGLAALQGPGEESLRFCFSLYDRDGNGTIDKDELTQILSMCITNHDSLDPDKVSMELSDAFGDIDADGNGEISFDEFKAACECKPYLVECLLSRKLSAAASRTSSTATGTSQ